LNSLEFLLTCFLKSIKKLINRHQKDSLIFKYDKRKTKKVGPLATLLIEHLTEETNGSITAKELKQILRRVLNLDVHQSTVQRVRHKYLGNNINDLINRLFP